MSDFSERVVMVTGAAGNLGRAVARAFLTAGAGLVLVDRASDRLPSLFPEQVGSSRHFLATSVDLRHAEPVEAMVREVVARLGRIDVLVNTVGGYWGGSAVHETAPEQWESLFDLNVRTLLVVSRAVIPTMIAQGYGKVVNVAARAALSGAARMGAYSAAKSAVVRITESMAAELKQLGINVNCVLPGTMDTAGNRARMPQADPSRWVRPEDVAEVILFLASDAARAVHGAAVAVYGTG